MRLGEWVDNDSGPAKRAQRKLSQRSSAFFIAFCGDLNIPWRPIDYFVTLTFEVIERLWDITYVSMGAEPATRNGAVETQLMKNILRTWVPRAVRY